VYDVIAKSLVFGTRNLDKVADVAKHDEGRIFATVGQFTNAAKAAANLDNAIGKTSSAAINAMTKAADSSKALKTVAKGVNWASKNVNPLLVGAAGYRVLMAEDKTKALNREIYGMSSMFAVEALMKRGFQTKVWQNLINKIPGKKGKIIGGIIQGLIFVAGSIAASTAGYKIGDKMNEKLEKKTTIIKKDDITAKLKESNNNYVNEFYLPGQNKELTA